jgi:transcriptional regulator with XRE-family HTH domain
MNFENEKINGKLLCRLRMAKGLAQREIAAKLKITQQAYSKMEKSSCIKVTTLSTVLIAMNSNIEELTIVNDLQLCKS